MAQILIFPALSRRRSARPSADPRGAAPGDAFETLLDGLRSAWWDGSSLGLSRTGLAALVGLEPSDATPRRRVSA